MVTRLAARSRDVVCTAVFAAVACCIAVLTSAHTAQAATPLGGLVLNPASGTSTTPISMTTESTGAAKGCPSPATNVVGFVTGPGSWTDILVANNSSTNVSNTDDFSIDVVDTFSGIAQSNNLTLVAGKYTITVYCQNSLQTNRVGEYSTSIWFTSPTAYQSTDPNVTPTPTPSSTGPAAVTTSTTLAASPPGSVGAGDGVTLTATISPAAAIGTVTFKDGANSLGTTALSGGTASFDALLPTGSHSLTAAFTPASPAAFTASSSAALSYTVTAASGPPLLGQLVINPATGTAETPISMTTVSSGTTPGCPAPSTNVVGFITGPGGWATGVLGVNNSSTGVSQTSDFLVNLADTFGGIAQSNQVAVVAGRYTITMYCQNSLGTTRYGMFTAPLWFTDADHYQISDPNSSQSVTQATITASPLDRATIGDAVSLTAAITPANAVGTVQFRDNTNGTFVSIGAPVRVSGGTATLTTKNLSFELYEFSAQFIPADATKFAPSVSDDMVYAVTLPIPPVPTAKAVIHGKVKVGSTITCSGTFTKARTTTYQWIRDRSTVVGGSSRAYRLVAADGGHAIRCRVLATNAGGTTSRTSVASKVAR